MWSVHEDSLSFSLFSESKAPVAHPWPFHHFTFQPSRKFYNQCKTFILQFVLVQPIVAFFTFFLSEGEGERGGGKRERGVKWAR